MVALGAFIALYLLLGATVGVIVGWILRGQRVASYAQQEYERLSAEREQVMGELTRQRRQLASLHQRLQELDSVRTRLNEALQERAALQDERDKLEAVLDRLQEHWHLQRQALEQLQAQLQMQQSAAPPTETRS